jgi:hypothetical protein
MLLRKLSKAEFYIINKVVTSSGGHHLFLWGKKNPSAQQGGAEGETQKGWKEYEK